MQLVALCQIVRIIFALRSASDKRVQQRILRVDLPIERIRFGECRIVLQ